MQKHNEARREEIQKESEEQKAALAVLLALVSEDAKNQPAAYLDETIVPAGGE